MGKERPRSRPANGVIVKNYEHYNRSFSKWNDSRGRYIGSRSDYEKALNEEGMVTQEEAEKTGLNTGAKHADYSISSDTLQLIESVRNTADSNGNIKPSDKAVEALNKKINRKQQEYNKRWLPDAYDTGGFTK